MLPALANGMPRWDNDRARGARLRRYSDTFREQHFGIRFANWGREPLPREGALTGEKAVKRAIEGRLRVRGENRHWQMDRHRLVLADAVDAVVALVLDGRVPPAAEVDHVARRRDREADARGLRREHQQIESGRPRLEVVDDALPLPTRRAPIDDTLTASGAGTFWQRRAAWSR